MQINLTVISKVTEHVPIGTHHIARVRFHLRWTLANVHLVNDVAAILQHMDQQLNAHLDIVYADHGVQPDDRVGLTLTVVGRPIPFYKQSKHRNNPIGQLMDLVADMLQSDQTIPLQDWRLVVDIYRNPRGGGFSRTTTPPQAILFVVVLGFRHLHLHFVVGVELVIAQLHITYLIGITIIVVVTRDDILEFPLRSICGSARGTAVSPNIACTLTFDLLRFVVGVPSPYVQCQHSSPENSRN